MNGRVFDCGAGKDRWTDTRSNVMAQDSESIRTLAGVLFRVIRRGIARDHIRQIPLVVRPRQEDGCGG